VARPIQQFRQGVGVDACYGRVPFGREYRATRRLDITSQRGNDFVLDQQELGSHLGRRREPLSRPERGGAQQEAVQRIELVEEGNLGRTGQGVLVLGCALLEVSAQNRKRTAD